MIIKCAIIDDEPLAAGLLKSYAEKTPFLQLIGSYGSALEAMKELRDNPAQLLFLDIQMPELKGQCPGLPDETHLLSGLPECRQQGHGVVYLLTEAAGLCGRPLYLCQERL